MNTAQIIQEKIDALERMKASDLAEIQKRIFEAEAAITEQTQEAEAAAAAMDTRRYAAAKAKIAELETKAAMYSDRLRQIENQVLVTSEESEKVISDLLNYERDLETEFAREAAEHFKALKELADKQRAAAAEAETVLQTWTQRIRANYISPITTYPDGTHRSPTPIQIHQLGYYGGDLLSRVDSFLSYRDIKDLVGGVQDDHR